MGEPVSACIKFIVYLCLHYLKRIRLVNNLLLDLLPTTAIFSGRAFPLSSFVDTILFHEQLKFIVLCRYRNTSGID